MREECFNTQEQILNYLGKKNDRNLIQRMIRNGKIYKEDGMYYLVVEEDNINSLKDKIHLLEEENRKLKEKSEGVNIEELANYKKWLDEANKAYEELESQKEEELASITKRCWDYMVQRKCCPTQTKKEFEYWIVGKEYADIQFSPDDLPF